MFHVKHSSLSSLEKAVMCNVEKKEEVCLPAELLIFILSSINKNIIVTLKEDEFPSFYNSYRAIYKNIDFLPPMSFFDKNSPTGFKSSVKESRNKVLSEITTKTIPRLMFSTKRAVEEKSIQKVLTKSFKIYSDPCYNSLVSWLLSSDYSRVDMVSQQGEYVLKGGIVDIFPYNKIRPARISFLSDAVEIFSFNLETQITNKKIILSMIANKFTPGDVSVKSLLREKLLHINYTEKNTSPLNSFFKRISFGDFQNIYKIKNINTVSNNLLVNNGYLFKNQLIVPPWFISKPSDSSKIVVLEDISFNSLSIGDRLVHKHHGISEYRGVYDFSSDGSSDERLLLEFSDGGKIYVSTQNLGLVEYHSSLDSPAPALDSLSKKGAWQKKKKAAKKQVDQIIDKLLKNYAVRSVLNKTPLLPDLELEKQFLESFPYEETVDQTRSWEEVSNDLSSKKPMDRLLCGDVGFGKTEIALRAAFRSVLSGKQVVVLAPTTILVNQHFYTFRNRLSPFSLNVGFVSTFKTKAENKNTFLAFQKNNIDIIIGTHSLLLYDDYFHNTGLLIIDEEHRFGVKQKDKIANIKNNIDILSMSATPIPRTLHMSISGIKNISTINTPPRSRFPINTQVKYYNIENIKSQILFEINRGGQVFFVHNSVKSLNDMVRTLVQILPNLIIKPAHGQEPKKELDKTMTKFIGGKIDVLVCTSIIETGIDIPNVNTVIINRAHRFGLSQLYQIRGRVGRSDKQAFAYLLIPKGFQLSKNAYKRLKSIEKNTSLGSGYNVSKSDMEIRGVGTVFGYKQSGGLSNIGYGLYSKLVKESLEKRRVLDKIFIIDPEETSVKLYIDMAIPGEYISVESVRIEFYRKLSTCDKLEDFSKIEYEMENRYGPIPSSVKNLINNYKTRVYCATLGIKKCVYSKGELHLLFLQEGVASSVDIFISKMIDLCSEQGLEPKFLPEDGSVLIVNVKLNKSIDIYIFVESILNKLTSLILT